MNIAGGHHGGGRPGKMPGMGRHMKSQGSTGEGGGFTGGNGGDAVPADVLEGFKRSPDDAEPLVALRSDLSANGSFGEHFVLADAERLRVVSKNGAGWTHKEWKVPEISKIDVDLLVGQGVLVAVIDGQRVEVSCFSHSRQREFYHAAKIIETVAKGDDPPKQQDGKADLPRYCPKCGRLLPERGGVCPACLKRGQVLIRLLKYLKGHWKRATALISLLMISAAIETLPPYLTKILIDDVLIATGDGVVTNIAWWDVSDFAYDRVGWLAIIVSLFLVSRLTLLLLQILAGRQGAHLGPAVIADVREELYHHIQRQSLSYYDKSSTGTLANRVMVDTQRVQSFLVGAVPHIGLNLLMVVMIGAILFSMDWMLTLAVIVPLPLATYFSKWFWKYIRGLFHRSWGRRARLHSVVNDSLGGIRVVKAFGQEDQELEKFDTHNLSMLGSEIRAQEVWATYYPVIMFFSMIGTFIVWYLGGTSVVKGAMTLGTLMAFFSYLGMFWRPLQMITRINEWVTRDLTAAERVFEVLDTEPDIVDGKDAISLDDLKGEVRFENVQFGYDPLRPVIKGINIDIQPGEMIGLVGRSGVGKTTIINLICRFYDPQEGRIFIDGNDLRQIKQKDWHRSLGIVPQESFLFNGTIAENIAYARQEAARDDIIRAARAANAHNFIMRFPDGYDTRVGERGSKVSGGERQRISIARAILHDPKILILDEATSSVDTQTEQQIQEALARLVKGRTVFAIAHRLSTLKNANRLLVIDDGKVAEFGSHDELVESGGIYANLVNAQRELSAITALGG
jgi:ATP-binding cassette, subfamily B, bacterial